MHDRTPSHHGLILLVEDDDSARISLTRVLERAGYTVTPVEDGETACALLEQEGPEAPAFAVVLTDLLLRELDGIGVLKTARASANAPEVILLTGYGTLNTAIEALRAGAYDYLLKPCVPDDLLRCVAGAMTRQRERTQQASAIRAIAEGLAHLTGTGSPNQEPGQQLVTTSADPSGRYLKSGNLLIDRVSHVVTFEGELLQLTPTEYDLLCVLAEAEGQLMRYREIARRTYNQEMSDHDAHQLLKTHIHNLRHKLNPHYIVNIRGVGYRLMVPSPDTSDSPQ